MEIINQLKQLAQDVTFLYAEDDEMIREQVVDFLSRFVGKLHVAEDGQQGLEMYDAFKPDIIISDIQMPRVGGLKMIERIREGDSKIPVIVTTAYNDDHYFMESIRLGITRYVLKPIDHIIFADVLIEILLQREDQLKARAYEKKLIQEKLQATSQQIIANLSNSYPMPTVVFKEEQIVFLNDAFTELLDGTTLNRLEDDPRVLDRIVIHKDGYADSLFDIGNYQRVMIPTVGGRKVYQLHHQTMHTEEDSASTQILVLNDVTELEQSRQSQRNYNRYLGELIKEQTKTQEGIPRKSKCEILKRSREIVSAETYLVRLDSAQKEAGTKTIKRDIDSAIRLLERYQQQSNRNSFDDLVNAIGHICATLQILDAEFDEIREALEECREILESNDFDNLFSVMLDYHLSRIFEALLTWNREIFMEENVEDIHEYDVDIFSACIDFELALSSGEKADFLLEGPGIKL